MTILNFFPAGDLPFPAPPPTFIVTSNNVSNYAPVPGVDNQFYKKNTSTDTAGGIKITVTSDYTVTLDEDALSQEGANPYGIEVPVVEPGTLDNDFIIAIPFSSLQDGVGINVIAPMKWEYNGSEYDYTSKTSEVSFILYKTIPQ